MHCRHALLLVAALAAPCPSLRPAEAKARPDQVLVIYNEDWQEDLDGSRPGQDSEEIARYYVQRRTDPETGLKPYLLGLSSKHYKDLRLNDPVLKEESRDNRLGLVYKGKGALRAEPWPLTKQAGNAVVGVKNLAAGQGYPRYALAFFRKEDLGDGKLSQLTVKATPQGGAEVTLVDLPRSTKRAENLLIAPLAVGTLVGVDFARMRSTRGTLSVKLTPTGKPPLEYSAEVSAPDPGDKPPPFIPIAGAEDTARSLVEKTGILEQMVSGPAVVGMLNQGKLGGIHLTKDEVNAIDTDTLVLSVGAPDDNPPARVLYADRCPGRDADLSVYQLKDGSWLLATGFQTHVRQGPALVSVKADRKDGGQFSREFTLYDLRDFEASQSGPDGIRDDAVYLRDIEEPVKEFLESNKTADGVPLKDHILYICVIRGLPLRVASLYGIERGTASSRRRADHGAGSALTQRIRMLYYDVTKVNWRPLVMANGHPGSARLLSISHSLKPCLVGMRYNPYVHPLAHNARRKQVWQQGGWDAVRRLDPPAFTSQQRARQPAEKFLYGAGRIDAPSVEWAKDQIDGALYGESYLTAKLGPIFSGAYQEGPLAAEALARLGFDAREMPDRADRALLYFGVFGYGAGSQAQLERGGLGARSCVWWKGFYPGSMGIAIRSYLGWDMSRPPKGQVSLFEQLVRNGITVTAGATRGAHDTNVTWWDSLVFNHLMLSGYEFGDAGLRASIYLDWTTSLVGDPLYGPDLSKTKPDATPPQVARKEDIELSVHPAGRGRFAVRARVKLANTDPEMAETVIDCWPQGRPAEKLTGANTRYTAAPHGFAMGLRPNTTYEVAVRLIDPYGNAFDSRQAFGPLTVRTGTARPTTIVDDRSFDQAPTLPLDIHLLKGDIEEQGELHLHFTAAGGRSPLPRIQTQGGTPLLGPGGAFRVGGAVVQMPRAEVLGIVEGRPYHLVLRWRRFPRTREAYLVAADGSEFVVAHTNDLPWNPADRIGGKIRISGGAAIRRVMVCDDAPTAPWENRLPLPKGFDKAAFAEANAGQRAEP